MTKDIVLWPNNILAQVSEPITEFGEEALGPLVKDMAETMLSANGIGLAAVQIGVLKRVFIIGDSQNIMVFVNPKVILAAEPESMPEGCLSFPRVYDRIERPGVVQAQWQDHLTGKEMNSVFTGLTARAFLHELDHLNGITFESRMTPTAQKVLRRQARRRG